MSLEVSSETKNYHFYNANPKGLHVSDCVVRAICTATEMSWEQTYRNLAELGMSSCMPMDSVVIFDEYLKRMGWVKVPAPIKKGTHKRYTGNDFASMLQANNVHYNVVASVGNRGNVVCFRDGKLWDTWDSTESLIGTLWVPQNFVNDFKNMVS